MNKYETIFIIRNDTTENQKREVISKIEEFIVSKGKITKSEVLGTKKLAYAIKGQDTGYYCCLEFETKPEATYELERLFRITEKILKFIVVKLEG